MMRHIMSTALFALPLVAHASALRAVNGDTVVIGEETIRLVNIDAPEIRHAQCDAELRVAKIAKARVSWLLSSGAITIRRGDGRRMKDNYGRTLAQVLVDGRDIARF